MARAAKPAAAAPRTRPAPRPARPAATRCATPGVAVGEKQQRPAHRDGSERDIKERSRSLAGREQQLRGAVDCTDPATIPPPVRLRVPPGRGTPVDWMGTQKFLRAGVSLGPAAA